MFIYWIVFPTHSISQSPHKTPVLQLCTDLLIYMIFINIKINVCITNNDLDDEHTKKPIWNIKLKLINEEKIL